MAQTDMLSREAIAYIIERVINNAKDAINESKNDPDNEFYQGERMAYYEILDTIHNELYIYDADEKEFGIKASIESLTI